jgi:hypothetical protein
VVVLDVNLPNVNGLDVPPDHQDNPRVIVISAMIDALAKAARLAGASLFFD